MTNFNVVPIKKAEITALIFYIPNIISSALLMFQRENRCGDIFTTERSKYKATGKFNFVADTIVVSYKVTILR